LKLRFKNILKRKFVLFDDKVIIIFALFTILFIYHGRLENGVILGGDFRIRPLEFFIDFIKNYKYVWWESLFGI